MKKLVLGLCGMAGLMVTGCGVVGTPINGSLYADIKYPSYYAGADKLGPGHKTGKAEAQGVLGIVAMGDASVAAACKAGGIKNIATVDTHATNLLGILQTYTTIVTGE